MELEPLQLNRVRMSRPLFAFSVCLAAETAAAILLEWQIALAALLPLLILLILWDKLVCRVPRGLWLCLLLAVLAALPNVAAHQLMDVGTAQYFAGRTCTVTGVVQKDEFLQNGSYTLLVERISDGKQERSGGFSIRVSSNESLGCELLDRVSVRGVTYLPRSASYPGGFDTKSYYESKGVYLMMSTRPSVSFVIAHDCGNFFERLITKLQTGISNRLVRLPQPQRGLLKGVLLGDKSELSDEAKENFSKVGISHILAVSGMHLSIIAGVVWTLFGGKKRKTGAVAVALVCLLYAGITGFAPSVTRSLVMQCLMCLALLSDRDYDGLTALGASVALILLWNPLAVGDVGLQLSVMATLGILLLAPVLCGLMKRREGKLHRLLWALWQILCVTAAATLFTAPLLFWYFGRVSLLCLLGSLLVVPLVPLLFGLGGVYCLVGGVVSAPLWLVTTLILRLSRLLAYIPFFTISTRSRSAVLAAAWLLLAVVLWLALQKGRRPTAKQCGFVVAVAVLLALVPSNTAVMGSGEFIFLDVGQGDCTVIHSGNHVVMVDCGTGGESEIGPQVVDELAYYGIGKIDRLIVTHYHRDHISGIPALMNAGMVCTLLLPPQDSSENCAQLVQTAQACGVPVEWMDEDRAETLDDKLAYSCLTAQLPKEPNPENENEACAVIRVDLSGMSLLVTGDLEQEGEVAFCDAYDEDIDLLKVAHHGSDTSTYYRFLEETTPKYAIISCKQNNSYGHPSPQVLWRLSQFTGLIGRTDEQGSLRCFVRDGALYRR